MGSKVSTLPSPQLWYPHSLPKPLALQPLLEFLFQLKTSRSNKFTAISYISSSYSPSRTSISAKKNCKIALDSYAHLISVFSPSVMKTATWPRLEHLSGEDLVGREVYLHQPVRKRGAHIVFHYDVKKDQHKLVSARTGAVRTLRLHGLRSRDWVLIPKRPSTPKHPVLEGTIIEFVRPQNSLAYHAMVYKTSRSGKKLGVVICETERTEIIQGIPWDIVDPSPCRADVWGISDMKDKWY